MQQYFVIVETPDGRYGVRTDDFTRTFTARGLFNLLRNNQDVKVISNGGRRICDIVDRAFAQLRKDIPETMIPTTTYVSTPSGYAYPVRSGR